MTHTNRLRNLCAEFDLEFPRDAVVLAILDATQRVQLLYYQAAAYGPDVLDTELIGTQFMLWCLEPPAAKYIVLPHDEPSHPSAETSQQ